MGRGISNKTNNEPSLVSTLKPTNNISLVELLNELVYDTSNTPVIEKYTYLTNMDIPDKNIEVFGKRLITYRLNKTKILLASIKTNNKLELSDYENILETITSLQLQIKYLEKLMEG